MKPELYYQLHDEVANLLEMRIARASYLFETKGYYTDQDMAEIDGKIHDAREQIELLQAVLEYIPDEDEERARDRRAEQDYCHTAGYPI